MARFSYFVIHADRICMHAECSILYREFFKTAHKEHPNVMLSVVIANLRVYFKASRISLSSRNTNLML